MSDLTPRKRKLTREFGERRVPPVNWERSTHQGSWTVSVMWTVIHWCRKFQILWMQRPSGNWQQLLGTVNTSQGEGGGILKKKIWLCLYLSVAQNPIFFFRCYSLFHQDTPSNPSSISFILGRASIPCFWCTLSLCRKCLKKTVTVVSCLLKCRSERMV
jgi:hypothetical protein